MRESARSIRSMLKRVLPESVVARVRARRRRRPPVAWGDLRSLNPTSTVFGLDRGTPVDRAYIETFLGRHADDIRGDVLEIAESTYCDRFGINGATTCHVLHVEEGNPAATLVGNLETGHGIPESAFDCMLLTQTFPFIYDVRAAVRTCHRSLRADGVLLATMAGISHISRYDMDRWGDYWRFTSRSAGRCFGEVFGDVHVEVETFGNVLTAVAFLHGLAAEELGREELEHRDPDYQVLVCVRAVK